MKKITTSKSPWKIGEKIHQKSVVYDVSGNMVADCNIFSMSSTDEINQQNAWLIKHAPEMYGLLKKVVASTSENISVKKECVVLIEKIEQEK